MFVSWTGSWKRKEILEKKIFNANQACTLIHSILVYLHVNFCLGKWAASYEVLALGKLRRAGTHEGYALSLQLFWISEINSKQKARTIHSHEPLSGAVVDSLAVLQAKLTQLKHLLCVSCVKIPVPGIPPTAVATCARVHHGDGAASSGQGCIWMQIHTRQSLGNWLFMSSFLNSSSAFVILLEHSHSVLWPRWDEINAFKTR